MTGKQTAKHGIAIDAPVTGDGDASLDADVREILACDGLPDPTIPVYVNDRIVSAVRAGFARGRELGAKDALQEAESCARAHRALDADTDLWRGYDAAALQIADALAARRRRT